MSKARQAAKLRRDHAGLRDRRHEALRRQPFRAVDGSYPEYFILNSAVEGWDIHWVAGWRKAKSGAGALGGFNCGAVWASQRQILWEPALSCSHQAPATPMENGFCRGSLLRNSAKGAGQG
jgi:hypothetical protein